jgi:hypothetical protein
MSDWLLVSHRENFDVCLKTRIWGLPDTISCRDYASQITDKDRVYFYVTAPISGVVGIGQAQGRVFGGDKPLWPFEKESNRIFFVYRFKFLVTSLLKKEMWKSKAIRLLRLRVSIVPLKSISPLRESDVDEILKQAENWGTPTGSVFLSHSHADNAFCRKLANDLRRSGVKVWLDEAEMQVGDSLIEKIFPAINEMQFLAAVLSKTSVRSKWVKKELAIAMTQEIESKRVKVLPLLLEDCEIPASLQDKIYADFRRPANYGKELAKAIKRVTSRVSESS